MAFNCSWNDVYIKKGMAAYPDNNLIRFVAKHFYDVPDRKEVKFLDLGCGFGASTWYLAREGFSVMGVDGSIVAIDRLKGRLKEENLEAALMCSDLTQLSTLEAKPFFDCVVDISCLCYIDNAHIKGVTKWIHSVLKEGGRVFSISPTTNCTRAPFNHTVDGVELNARFVGHVELEENFSIFNGLNIETASYVRPDGDYIGLWLLDAVK